MKKEVRIVICLLLFTVLLQSCSQHSDTIESDVMAYQQTIDSLLESVIIPIRSDIESQITENNIANKDTFQLARKRIPITTIQFLISHEYFTLDSLLVAYQNHKIPAEKLIEQLQYSQHNVDSLINSEAVRRFSE